MTPLDETPRRDGERTEPAASATKPHLFIVLECERSASRGARYALDGVDEIVTGRGAERVVLREGSANERLVVRVPDPMMSSTHARVLRTPEGWRFEDAGSTNGSIVNGVRATRALVGDDDLVELGATLFVLRTALPTPADTPCDVDLASSDSLARGFRTLLPLHAQLAGDRRALPPLRDRREDLGLLIAEILAAIAPERAAQLRLTPECGRALYRYGWPQNVGELERALRAAVVFAVDGVIDVKHLPDAVRTGRVEAPSSGAVPTKSLTEDDVRTRDALVLSLTEHRGNVSEVARTMGRTRMQIHRWMKRFSIDPETFRRA